jgi:MFS transporter, PAT family, beta-lactamase induction signal transducer AmpG
MGLTYTILTNASALMFKNLGMDNGQAAEYASYLILAYTIKPLFSPIVEMYKTKKFFVISTQAIFALCILLSAMAMSLPNYLTVLLMLFWLMSVMAAMQDISTDGVYITALDRNTQLRFNGLQGLSWNVAPVFVSGGLVYPKSGSYPLPTGVESTLGGSDEVRMRAQI